MEAAKVSYVESKAEEEEEEDEEEEEEKEEKEEEGKEESQEDGCGCGRRTVLLGWRREAQKGKSRS